MYVVMGATGNVGAAVADALLARDAAVTVLTREPDKADGWRARGATVAYADAEDAGSLREVLRRGRRAFLLNPPGDPAHDVDAAERRTVAAILAALAGAALEKVVAASTYVAQPGDSNGDLGSLWLLEESLRAQPIPAAIDRGAYYMSNWSGLADAVRESGTLPSMFPADMPLPMVAPVDLGRAAAERLMSDSDDVGIAHVEGPARYTPADVAAAFARHLTRPVEVVVTPPDQFEAAYRKIGFSDAAAGSFARMTAATLASDFAEADAPIRGVTTLDDYLAGALTSASGSRGTTW